MQYGQGLMQKFKLDRLPTAIEMAARLNVEQKASEQPDGIDSLLAMNSSYLEISDPYSGLKGFAESHFTLIFFLLSIMAPYFFLPLSLEQWKDPEISKDFWWFFLNALISTTAIITATLYIKFIFYNCFSYKNWPTRFNRRTGMVYVFNSNRKGKILIAPWEKVFFCVAEDTATKDQTCLRGYILDEAGIIRDGFAFGWNVASGSNKELILRQWEFIRRYMEDGPENLPLPQRYVARDPGFWACQRYMYFALRALLYMGIAGLLILAGIWAGHFHARAAYIAGVVLTAFGFGPGLFRYFAYKTSRTPQWPAEVEAACQVEPNDPYLHPRDGDKVY